MYNCRCQGCMMPKSHTIKLPDDVNPDGFITIKQAAEILSVKIPTLYDWIKTRGFPAYRIGGVNGGRPTYRIIPSELLRWVDVHFQPTRKRA